MGLPLNTIAFNVYVGDAGLKGRINEFNPPKVTLLTEDHRSGDMIGNVKLDMGIDEMAAEFKVAGHEAALYQAFGGLISGTAVRFIEVARADDSESPTGIEHVMQGRITEIDPGTTKGGDKTEHTFKIDCTYYKKVQNGTVLIEADKLNAIFSVGGIDRYAEVRAMLGN